MSAVRQCLTRNAKRIIKKSRVRAPWTIVVIMRQYSRPHRMGPVLPSSLSMDVPITTTVTTLRNFLMSVVLPVGNVKYIAAVKICAMKVTTFKHVNFWDNIMFGNAVNRIS